MDAMEMLTSIKENINIWDKWTYDTAYENFVFFTLSDCYETRMNVTYYRYKAKVFRDCKRATANKILGWLAEEEFSTFTSQTDTFEFEEPIDEDEEGNAREYFQYFLTNMSDDDAKFTQKFFPDVKLAKSNKLDCWVLCVDHFGTSWDYVWTECREIMTPDKWNEKNRGTIKIDRSYVAHYMKTE